MTIRRSIYQFCIESISLYLGMLKCVMCAVHSDGHFNLFVTGAIIGPVMNIGSHKVLEFIMTSKTLGGLKMKCD